MRVTSQAVGKVLAANQKWKCASCHKLLEATYQIDHREPLCRGGKNSIENLWVLCASCHALKTLAELQSQSSYGKMPKGIVLTDCPFYKTTFSPARDRDARCARRASTKEIDSKHTFRDFKKGDDVEVWVAGEWIRGKVEKCIGKGQQIVVVLETLVLRRCVPSHVRHKI